MKNLFTILAVTIFMVSLTSFTPNEIGGKSTQNDIAIGGKSTQNDVAIGGKSTQNDIMIGGKSTQND